MQVIKMQNDALIHSEGLKGLCWAASQTMTNIKPTLGQRLVLTGL